MVVPTTTEIPCARVPVFKKEGCAPSPRRNQALASGLIRSRNAPKKKRRFFYSRHGSEWYQMSAITTTEFVESKFVIFITISPTAGATVVPMGEGN